MTYTEDCDAIKAASNGELTYIFVPKAKEDCDKASTDDGQDGGPHRKTHLVLWVSSKYGTEYKRIEEECGGRFEDFKKELDGNKKAKAEHSVKLLQTLALTQQLVKDSEWTEDIPKACALVKQLAQYWRGTILKKTDDKLGLGEKPEEAEQEASRVALYRLLEHCKVELDLEDDPTLFNYEPNKKKGSRTKSGRALSTASSTG